ncbi:FAD-dependent oxidoreductase [bacterium]|nr:FAD-dependent oxidoreductase [bacterium]
MAHANNTSHGSIWLSTAEAEPFEPLAGDVYADVAIVGGGLTGILTAWLLKDAGKSVILVERERVGHGETGHTSGHLTEVFDRRYFELVSKFSKSDAALANESARDAMGMIENMTREMGIDCDFARIPGYLYVERQSQELELRRELTALRDLDIDAEWIESPPLPFVTRGALRFADQARFHPLRFLNGLAARIPGNGCAIHEHTRVIDVREGEPCRVITDRGTVLAENVVIATNSPATNRYALLTKLAAYRTYAIGVHLKTPAAPMDALFWDTETPYHYIRTQTIDGEPVVIVGGEDHKTGAVENTEACYIRLEEYARARFDVEWAPYRWSGQILNPVDGLPYIGRNVMSDRVFIATGYAGTGLTGAAIASMILSDAILEIENRYAGLYDARRVKPLASAARFLAENKDYPARLVTDRLNRRPVGAGDSEIEDLPRGYGRVIALDGERIAVYRDDTGKLHAMDPTCTHLGCHVAWNGAERSWDCPCHGSRYTATGRVIHGPATQDLHLAPLPEYRRTPAEPRTKTQEEKRK